jgi:hypothetical protein
MKNWSVRPSSGWMWSDVGATLVAQAIQKWSHVSDRAFRVLVAMAVTAKDRASRDTPPNLYFGGQDHLARAVRRDRGGTEENAIRTVKRAIQELTQAGAIRCTQVAVLGSNAVYELTLNVVPIPVDNPGGKSTYIHNGRDTTSPPAGDTSSPPRRDTTSPDGGTPQVPPSKEPLEEPLEELKEEEGVDVRSDVAVVAPGLDSPKPEIPPPECPEPTCAKGFILIGDPPMLDRCPRCNSNVIPFPERRSA